MDDKLTPGALGSDFADIFEMFDNHMVRKKLMTRAEAQAQITQAEGKALNNAFPLTRILGCPYRAERVKPILADFIRCHAEGNVPLGKGQLVNRERRQSGMIDRLKEYMQLRVIASQKFHHDEPVLIDGELQYMSDGVFLEISNNISDSLLVFPFPAFSREELLLGQRTLSQYLATIYKLRSNNLSRSLIGYVDVPEEDAAAISSFDQRARRLDRPPASTGTSEHAETVTDDDGASDVSDRSDTPRPALNAAQPQVEHMSDQHAHKTDEDLHPALDPLDRTAEQVADDIVGTRPVSNWAHRFCATFDLDGPILAPGPIDFNTDRIPEGLFDDNGVLVPELDEEYA